MGSGRFEKDGQKPNAKEFDYMHEEAPFKPEVGG